MPPTLPPDGVARSAEELNAAIRAFWIDGRGHPQVPLSKEQRAEYEQLCAELRQVQRGDVTTAA